MRKFLIPATPKLVMEAKEKILIIDDDQDMVEALKIVLEKETYIVRSALNGKQGLEAVRSEEPDLVILDLLLPKKSGLDLYHNLKRHSKYKDIPILILTALSPRMKNKIFTKDEKDIFESEQYLDKPIDPSKLLTKVRNLLQKRGETG